MGGGGGRGGQDTIGQSPYLAYSNRQVTQEPPTLHCAKQEMGSQVFLTPTSLRHHLPGELQANAAFGRGKASHESPPL